MIEITVGNGQQLEDIALREYGDALGNVIICTDNGLSLNDLLYAGQKLKIRTQMPEFTENNILIQRQIVAEQIFPNAGIFGTIPLSGYALEDYFAEDYNE